MPIFQNNKKQGFTLIEIMVAILVMSIGVLGVFSLVPMAISLGTENSNRFTAAQLALEGLEIVRNIRDSNWLEQSTEPDNPWNEGLTDCLSGCGVDYTALQDIDSDITLYDPAEFLKVDSQGFFNYASGADIKFKRKITIDSGTDDLLKISVEVEWSNKHPAIVLQEKLYDWR